MPLPVLGLVVARSQSTLPVKTRPTTPRHAPPVQRLVFGQRVSARARLRSGPQLGGYCPLCWQAKRWGTTVNHGGGAGMLQASVKETRVSEHELAGSRDVPVPISSLFYVPRHCRAARDSIRAGSLPAGGERDR